MSGHRPCVVLLHASASSARQWQGLTETLTPGFRVHAVEFHGHGAQPAWGGDAPLSLADDAALVEPLLQDGGAHLVGHSYGAAVALKLAAAHPGLVRSVAAFEPVVFRMLSDDPASRQPAQEVFAVADWIRDRLALDQAISAAQRFIEFWSGDGAWRSLHAGRQHAVATRMRSVLRNFDALFREPFWHAQLSRVRRPMLFLTGARTVSATRRIGDLLRAALPAAHHEVLPGMGHMGPITHAAHVNRRIAQFLHANVAPDSTRYGLRPAPLATTH